MLKRSYLAVAFLGLTLLPLSSKAASFDCASAVSDVEGIVCADPELSALDDDVGDAYTILRAQSRDQSRLQREQREWLATRNRCKDRNCIKNAYEVRLADLKPRLKVPASGDCSLEDLDDGALSLEACLAIRQSRARREQRNVDPCAQTRGANPWMFCLQAQVEREKSLVNRAFLLAMRVVEDPVRLKEEQDYWVHARYGECRFESRDGIEHAICELKTAQERREQLYKMLRGDCHDYRDFCIPRKR
jgi:uncharacterized protein